MSKDEAFNGNILFGSFYFVLRDNRVIRPHFIKLGDDTSPHSVISNERMAESLRNLRRMFQFIKDNISGSKTVRGNTWLCGVSFLIEIGKSKTCSQTNCSIE